MAAAPPQPCSTTTLPALMEELVEEILLRIPPDEPAHLIRAALVCKAWRRIILSDDDTAFLRRYREFHRSRLPLLGFFYNCSWHRYQQAPQFVLVPTTTAFPSLGLPLPVDVDDGNGQHWRVFDCRHGRVLLEHRIAKKFIIWDPISNDCQELPANALHYWLYAAAVLCAAAGCDHHDCRGGGPFLVVHVHLGAVDAMDDDATVKACVYSSEARAWGTPVSSQLDMADTPCFMYSHRAAVIGDEVYFVTTPRATILKYHLVKRCVSSFSSPSICSEAWEPLLVVLMQSQDGSLGLATVSDLKLYIWSSRMVSNHEGRIIVPEWVQERVIDLDRILPIENPYIQVYVTGFAEGVGILFISTHDEGVGTAFTFQLESGRVTKIPRQIQFSDAFPFISLFTHSM